MAKSQKQFFEIENDLFIGVIYISPKNSSNVKHKQDTYQILEKELFHYSRQGDIMLGGDFNSRLGKSIQIISSQIQMIICQLIKILPWIMIISGITKIRMRIHMENYYQIMYNP